MEKISEKFQNWKSVKVTGNSDSVLLRITTEEYCKLVLITKTGAVFDKISLKK